MLFYFMIAAFLVTVVGSTLLAFEYARIDSIAVDYKVEVFEHAVGGAVFIDAVRTNSTVLEQERSCDSYRDSTMG